MKKKKAQLIKKYTTLGLTVVVIGVFVVLAVIDEKKSGAPVIK